MIVSLKDNVLPKAVFLSVLLVCSVLALLYLPFWGSATISFNDIFSSKEDYIINSIFWQMRIPRVVVGYLAGGTFALCGMVFQALFRNALVDPSTLGTSAGASFGAAAYIWLGISFSLFGLSGICIFAFLGALLSVFIVSALAKSTASLSISKMLLAGIAVSFLFISLILLIQYLSDISQSFRITRWLMGGLYIQGYEDVVNILPFAILSLASTLFFTNELNLFTTGEETAISRGVDADMVVRILFFIVCIVIGGIVSICGPIAFVGLIAPHICRLLIGWDHRSLTPATFMCGGLLLAACDTIGRTIAPPTEIPVGIITALIGGPFFLWLLYSKFNE